MFKYRASLILVEQSHIKPASIVLQIEQVSANILLKQEILANSNKNFN